MSDSSDPIETIQNWQNWYKKQPADLITSISMAPEDNKKQTKAQAVSFFADALAEFANELTAEELFECLLQAAYEQYANIEKDYIRCEKFLSLLRCDGIKK